MKKYAVIGAVALGLVAGGASEAQAAYGPYLGNGEACREAGAMIHSEWKNVVPGSSYGSCRVTRFSRSNVWVSMTYKVYGAGWWKTTIGIREDWSTYNWRIISDRRA